MSAESVLKRLDALSHLEPLIALAATVEFNDHAPTDLRLALNVIEAARPFAAVIPHPTGNYAAYWAVLKAALDDFEAAP